MERGIRLPLRPTRFSVYASSGLFARFHPLRLRRNTRYRWLARPFRTGTFTLQGAPNFAWRSNVKAERLVVVAFVRPVYYLSVTTSTSFLATADTPINEGLSLSSGLFVISSLIRSAKCPSSKPVLQ